MKFFNKNNFYLFLYKNTINFSSFHSLMRQVHLSFTLKILFIYLKFKHDNIINLFSRHSITEKNKFNLFISDIDLDIIIENQSDYLNILKTFSLLRKIFIFLDWPEIYFQSEYDNYQKLKNSSNWEAIETIRLIRKINWEINKPKLNPYDEVKSNRSIQHAFIKITGQSTNTQNILFSNLSKIYSIYKPYSINSEVPSIFLYSAYLETNQKASLKILCSCEEFLFITSLLPGENTYFSKWDTQLSNLKKEIIAREYLISQVSLRLKQIKNEPTKDLESWIEKLSMKINET